MKSNGFHYEVEMEIEFSKSEIERLVELGDRHYDGWCQACARPGGFLWGWKNQIEMLEDEPILAQAMEIDTARKVMEMGDTQSDRDLGRQLLEAHRKATAEYERVNKHQGGSKS